MTKICCFDLEPGENVLKTNLKKYLRCIIHWSLSTEDTTFTQKFSQSAQFPQFFVFQSLVLPAVLHWTFFQGSCDFCGGLIRLSWCELASRRSSPCADGGGESGRRTPASGLMRESLLSELLILLPLINPAGH